MGGRPSAQKDCNGQATVHHKGLHHCDSDGFQFHAVETVRSWGLDVAMEFSQEYGKRESMRVKHSNGHLYSPATTGWVGIPPMMHGSYNRAGMQYDRIPRQAWECHIDRVIKVGIKNEQAHFNDPVAYHGIRVDSDAPLPSGRWRGGLRPLMLQAAHGCHGHGVYLTPSFAMAASYGFRRWSSEEHFNRHGPNGTCYLAVLMCAVHPRKYKKESGSAFSHNTDGWNPGEIEWVVKDPQDARVYGVCMCYFKPLWEGPQGTIQVGTCCTNPGKLFLSCRADGLVDLYSHNDGSGRQLWNLVDIGQGKYNIRIQGGTNHDKNYLSCTPNGRVDLFSHDDGSGRQQWFLEEVGNGQHHVKISGGTDPGKHFLSCREDGYVDLYSHDDGSGRQRWSFSVVAPSQ